MDYKEIDSIIEKAFRPTIRKYVSDLTGLDVDLDSLEDSERNRLYKAIAEMETRY